MLAGWWMLLLQDYAKLEPKEWAESEEASVAAAAKATLDYKTAVPAGHPFAHARLLNVVAKTKSIGKTIAVSSSSTDRQADRQREAGGGG